MVDHSDETQKVKERYERRSACKISRYNPLNPNIYMAQQEKERALIRCIHRAGLEPVSEKRVLEIGCGSGGNLLQLLQLGFQPENLVGNELLLERYQKARRLLPEATELLLGDAAKLSLPIHSFDIVYQSTVFTSILDSKFQSVLAEKMWSLVKPGGGVLWYDFIYDNPGNPDVRGVSQRRVRELFPHGVVTARRVTLAPPISRRVARFHPSLYTFLNMMPFLRTHLLCWLSKSK